MADGTVPVAPVVQAETARSEGPLAHPRSRVNVGEFLPIALQVGLVLGVALVYRIELERGFGVVAALIFLGFLIHSWLPLTARVPFFLLLTAIAIVTLLGANGIWLVGLGMGLIGLCHLPIPWSTRVGLIIATGVGLALLQVGWIDVPWSGVVIPILAAMFMFRLILYLYDLKNDRTPGGLWQRVAYFFMLPNVCFPLFPVVDYKTFLRTYYDAPAGEIYQKGVYWMLRGVSHLLLYRLVYYLLPRAESDLSGIIGVYVFAAMTYGLYLRVSGLFHLIVGSLCLFGFNLPLTNNHYFLASSFTDLWRRINIYWKDFMMTVVFYPIFMSVRHWNMSSRLVFATAAVFLVTWFLHSYQWFWLQGVFPLTGTDMVFWGFLGAALAFNAVWEARRGSRRRLIRSQWSPKEALGATALTIGVFSVMAMLWSLWDSSSLIDWGYRILRVRESTPGNWLVFGGLLGGALVLGVGAHWLSARGWGLARAEQLVWRQAFRFVPGVSLAMIVIGLPGVYQQVGGPLETAMTRIQSTGPNRIDRMRGEAAYYETLSRAIQLGPVPDVRSGTDLPGDWVGFRDSPAARRTGDLRGWEIVPEVKAEFRGTVFYANRWGLRDHDYEMGKPEGTYRIAILGASDVMGSGVDNEETFENVLEARLNRELGGEYFERFEILNFAVGGYSILQALYVAEHRVPDFAVDAIIYVFPPDEASRMVIRLKQVLELDSDLKDYEYITSILRESRVHGDLPTQEFERRLQPYKDDLLSWACRSIVTAIRGQGAVPIFVLLPEVTRNFASNELARLKKMGAEEDAIVVSLTNVFRGYDRESLRVAPWDDHPNVRGHQLIADALFAALLENANELGLSPGPVAQSSAVRSEM